MFELSKPARILLLYSGTVMFLIVAFGLIVGLVAEMYLGHNLFERFGALVVALGAYTFGIVSSELLNRSQDALFARDYDDPKKPTSVSNIRKTLKNQALVVSVGTLQWGFGSILWEHITC